ncbi:hypothetical protein WOLCODRAFT_65056 [Wolfiporia cocos MD-104 SS10]|uniref:Uncharacterized protein n=1 Tax=Wolfiporia cocos (strain MD-104) TaxID=742152 RepID=A0A2H3JG17_WOLCO|nr:hypothetical protein WOLCODRAFT_65056 [Wolfiporia cocos MD-104 SS10]
MLSTCTAFRFATRTCASPAYARPRLRTSSIVLARMMATGGELLDVTREIKLDHDNIRELLERYKKTTDIDAKKPIANTLIREMAIHGDAKSISIYNNYASMGLNEAAFESKEGDVEVSKLVNQADMVTMSDPKYHELLVRAVRAFVENDEREQSEQFPKLKEKLSPEDSDKLARAFLRARTLVSPRPHPFSPQTGGPEKSASAARNQPHEEVRIMFPFQQ